MALNEFSFLYVEDDEVAQDIIKMMLEDEVAEFYQAYNGKEGLEIYKEKKPDIILADINMPVMDGLKMSKLIKEINKNQPIIIISAHDDKKTLIKSIETGITNFVSKPININELIEKLKVISIELKQKKSEKEKEKQEFETLHNLAYYDNLTNIPNRTFFKAKLSKSIENATKESLMALFFIDLDDFKPVNDTYGHHIGDLVLKTITQRILEIIKTKDSLARIGGDEFALILENITTNEVNNSLKEIAQDILKAVSSKITIENNDIYVSCSIGISISPIDSINSFDIVAYADEAMYKAKKMGKNNYILYSELNNE